MVNVTDNLKCKQTVIISKAEAVNWINSEKDNT